MGCHGMHFGVFRSAFTERRSPAGLDKPGLNVAIALVHQENALERPLLNSQNTARPQMIRS